MSLPNVKTKRLVQTVERIGKNIVLFCSSRFFRESKKSKSAKVFAKFLITCGKRF